jgi:hypothetical protein
MRFFIFTSLLLIFGFISSAQRDSSKSKFKKFYLTWGYTKAYYSKSTIHFVNNSGSGKEKNYDFTVHNATAHDRMDLDKIGDIVNVTIPQFVFRIGYRFNEKWGIELNYDHTKYVVDDYQTARVEGRFDDTWVDSNMVLDPNTFLHFEHTDGANFWMINAVRDVQFYKPNKKFIASWVIKPGAGIVIPRTDVTLFGENLNNDWKVAGWIVGVETGLRLQFLNHGFFEFVGKGSYANYVNAFVLGNGNGRANHHFFTTQLTGTIGVIF